MSHFSTAYLTDLKSQDSRVYGSKDADNTSDASDFRGEGFFSSCSDFASKQYCPYSIRESQESMEYKYDVLLIYDPDENSYFVDKLMEHLTPQNLKIFDFLRDSPPGMPQRKVLQSALKFCRYTCVVITRKFLTNFWSQLKADMSIQDMLDNEEKLYSVIVVVMDLAVKKDTLPLDLATLSPLFCSEKFFENRLKLAFSKSNLFPIVSNESLSSNDTCTKAYSSQLSTAVMQSHSDSLSFSKSKESISPNVISMNRIPQEHGESPFISPLPISLFNTQDVASSVMNRATSITVSSTGNRQPTESTDQSSSKNSKFCTSYRPTSSFHFHPHSEPLGSKGHENFVKYPHEESIFATGDFSSTSFDHHKVLPIPSQSYEPNNFTEVGGSLISNLSDLEISLDTPSASLALENSARKTHRAMKVDNKENGFNSVCSELDITKSSDPNHFTEADTSLESNLSDLEISLATQLNSSILENMVDTADVKVDAKENGLDSLVSEISSTSCLHSLDFVEEIRYNESASIGARDFGGKGNYEGQCMSLPADIRKPTIKKSTSLLDLVRGQFVRVRKNMSFRYKKDKQQKS